MIILYLFIVYNIYNKKTHDNTYFIYIFNIICIFRERLVYKGEYLFFTGQTGCCPRKEDEEGNVDKSKEIGEIVLYLFLTVFGV